MKTKDITTGAEYAWKPNRHTAARRVRTIESFTVSSPKFGPDPSGWIVEFLDDQIVGWTRTKGSRLPVTNREIFMPWSDFEKENR